MRRARGSSISARRPSRAVALPVIGVHPSLGFIMGHVGPPPRVARERPLAPGSHTRISPPHDSDHRAPSLPPRKSSHPLHPGRGQGHPQGGSSPEAPHEDRSKVSGTADRPRISVYRSNQHTYVQVIDDENQTTLCAVGTMSPKIKRSWAPRRKTKTVDAAREVGKAVGAICVEKGIKTAVFDRGGFVYHGRVKAVAEAAREAGVEF